VKIKKFDFRVAGQAYCVIPDTLEPVGTTQDINWDNGNFQKLDLGSASGDVTITFSNSEAGGSFVLIIIQSATARSITWPASMKWEGGTAPSLSTGEDEIDIVSIIYDGTNHYASILNDLS
jgi:hypothetical protein